MISYRLGLSQATLIDMLALGMIPKATLPDYPETVVTGDGGARGLGLPQWEWRLNGVSLANINRLRLICPGRSAGVYVSTLAEDDTYPLYTAKMIWPNKIAAKASFTYDLVLQFRGGVLV